MRIYPFRALRYDPSRVQLEDVVTQPYDKISPAMQQAYYDRSPYNLIRVILGRKNEADNDSENVYTRAASSLNSWRKEGILKEESEPALFAYSLRYTGPATTEIRERKGLICLGHLYDYAEKVVYRHEQTLAKPKSDRLNLFKATRTYCEQIYMLYSDPGFSVEKLIFGSVGNPSAPDESVTDEFGVVHELWKVTDERIINLIVTSLADKKLIIADGHHRYETSTAYARERAAELGLSDPTVNTKTQHIATESPSNEADDNTIDDNANPLPTPAFPEAAMMMTLVNMDAPGITILPTHRVVFGLKDFSAARFVERATPYFDVEKLAVAKPAQDADDKTDAEEKPDPAKDLLAPLEATTGVAFLAATREGNYLLKAKPEAIAAALQGVTERQRQLDVVQLHSLVLEQLLGLTPESIRNQENLRYLRSASEAVAQVERGDADV